MKLIKNFLTCVTISLLILLAGCNTKVINDTPLIKADFSFTELSDEDFQDIGTKGYVKEDFRKVNLNVRVKNSSNITDRTLTIPDLKNIMNSYDMERYWYGQYTTEDNPGKDACYTYDIMFLSKGLSEDDIANIFKASVITVTWTDKSTKENKSIINLADIIEFKQ